MFFHSERRLFLSKQCVQSLLLKSSRRPETFENIANLYGLLLACIKTKFCTNKIYVCQHFSSSPRCAHFYAGRTSTSLPFLRSARLIAKFRRLKSRLRDPSKRSIILFFSNIFAVLPKHLSFSLTFLRSARLIAKWRTRHPKVNVKYILR